MTLREQAALQILAGSITRNPDGEMQHVSPDYAIRLADELVAKLGEGAPCAMKVCLTCACSEERGDVPSGYLRCNSHRFEVHEMMCCPRWEPIS